MSTTRGSRSRIADMVDDSPIENFTIPISAGSGSGLFASPAEELDDIAQKMVQAELLAKRAALDLLNAQNERTLREIERLQKTTPTPLSGGSREKDSDDESELGKSLSLDFGTHGKSTTIIKELEKRLLSNTLDDSTPKISFLWLKNISVYLNHGGDQFPWNFLSPSRCMAFEDFLSTHTHDSTCLERYSGVPYSSASDCKFIKEYIRFVVDENDLDSSDLLDHCAMEPNSVFSAPSIKNYIVDMRVTIKMFEHMKILSSLQIKKLVNGLQPFAFRNFIIKEYKEIFSGSWLDAVASITEAYKTEQNMARKSARGFGIISRTIPKVSDKGETNKNGFQNRGGGEGNGKRNDVASQDKTGKADGKFNPPCRNCKSTTHLIGQCDRECTSCRPSCGMRPSKCPVYLKNRPVFSSTNDDRDRRIARLYKSNNARAADSTGAKKSGKPKVSHNFTALPITNSSSGVRRKKKVSWMIPLTEARTISCHPSRDDFHSGARLILTLSLVLLCPAQVVLPLSHRLSNLPRVSYVLPRKLQTFSLSSGA